MVSGIVAASSAPMMSVSRRRSGQLVVNGQSAVSDHN